MMKQSDEQLAGQALAGNSDAATLLVDRFYARIYGYLRRQTFSNEDAADLTQKTFAKSWNSLNAFREEATFSTWIYRIAYHTYVDWVRKQTRRHQREVKWWELNQAPTVSPFREFEEREESERVFALVEELSEEERRAIHLHYYEHLTL